MLTLTAAGDPALEEQLWNHRNLGKAFYENQTTQAQAVTELEAALVLAPSSVRERINYGLALLRANRAAEGIAELERAQKQDAAVPHTWFNLGIAYKRAQRTKEAVAQLEGFVRLVPNDAIAHYNLGALYKLEGDPARSLAAFERAARTDPDLAGPHFQLATAYRQVGKTAEAQRAMEIFRQIKARNANAAVPEDLEWSYYAELIDEIAPGQAAPPAPGKLSFERKALAEGIDGASAALFVLDADGSGGPDLLALSSRGAKLFLGGSREVASGLTELDGFTGAAAGDFDNNGLTDLVLLTGSGATIYANRGGRFEKLPVAVPAGPFTMAQWLDWDHDYDEDLLLFGPNPALLRNNGNGTFTERTVDFPFVKDAAEGGARFDLVADTQGIDLAVSAAGKPVLLYRDRLAGRYEAKPVAAVSGARTMLAGDLDQDGWTDLLAVPRSAGEASTLLLNDRREGFRAAPLPGAIAPALLVDLENRGTSDLLAGGRLWRNDGAGKLRAGESPAELAGAVALAAADFDGDGRVDLAAVSAAGALALLRNTSVSSNRWLSVELEGVKNLKHAPGAEVEVKAGARYQKKLYEGAPVHFGLGSAGEVDAVRITWPNGLIQNEVRQKPGALAAYKEAQRLSGSCPMIYTWNGREFEFITDVLGVAPLGASAGDGQYFPVDHDEFVQIGGESLVEREGKLEIRIVEELREVAFLDEVRLLALDHPEEVELFTNDKFKGPPFPEFRLFGVERRLPPLSALDHRGQDVRAKILARDETYADTFARDYAGVAELHSITLDFGPGPSGGGPSGEAILVLSGWVDWADGSTFLGAAQNGTGLVMPYLEVQDEHGAWQTVIADMGIPAGKPKTIVVDLSGKFLSAARKVRITSNLCVYWDEIFLAESAGEPEARVTELPPTTADLRFRGFSRVVIHPERKQPEHFVYAEHRALSMWNPTPGLYTRYGEVAPLLADVDDRFVILGSGDEIRLLFDARALPPLPPGWRRDYLLEVDGWAKDADANTAHGQTVEPLPYHGMPQYPYTEPHAFPDDDGSRRWREQYNTRPALRLIRPLSAGNPNR